MIMLMIDRHWRSCFSHFALLLVRAAAVTHALRRSSPHCVCPLLLYPRLFRSSPDFPPKPPVCMSQNWRPVYARYRAKSQERTNGRQNRTEASPADRITYVSQSKEGIALCLCFQSMRRGKCSLLIPKSVRDTYIYDRRFRFHASFHASHTLLHGLETTRTTFLVKLGPHVVHTQVIPDPRLASPQSSQQTTLSATSTSRQQLR